MKRAEIQTGSRSILIEGEAVEVDQKQIPLARIQLDPANPRIQHAVKVRVKKAVLTQDELGALILEQPGVSDLFKTIRDNGGLMEPIFVRPDGRIIEGNCRAASIMRLHRANKLDKRWHAIPAFVVPSITDRQVAVLQGNFHVAGKNKWRAYEKAGHLHSMATKLGMGEKSIAKALGMQERVVTRLLETYKTMSEKVLPKMKGNGLDKWSHVEEFFKNRELEEFRKKSTNVDQFVDLVVNKKVRHGADVRKLPRILKHARATSVLKRGGVDHAVAVLGKHDPTADSVVFRKLKEVTRMLSELSAADIARLRNERKAKELLQELYQVIRDVAKVSSVKL